MANLEGVLRMRKLATTLALVGLIALTVGTGLTFTAFHVFRSTQPHLGYGRTFDSLPWAVRYAPAFLAYGQFTLVYLGVFPLLVALVIYGTAWIVEGFMMPVARD